MIIFVPPMSCRARCLDVAQKGCLSDDRAVLPDRPQETRAAAFLRSIGIEIERDREGRARSRIIRIIATASVALPELVLRGKSSSTSSARGSNINDYSEIGADEDAGADDVRPDADEGKTESVHTNPLKNKHRNAADAADDEFPIKSDPPPTGKVWEGGVLARHSIFSNGLTKAALKFRSRVVGWNCGRPRSRLTNCLPRSRHTNRS